MGFMGFFKRGKEKKNNEDKNESNSKIGAGIAINESVKNAANQAREKYSRPDYNPQTRKQFYDDGNVHKNVLDKTFANGKKVYDPYSGAELVKKQKDAKLQFGEDWQSHAAEADHIDPLSQVFDRTKRNPFLTSEDIQEIGNDEENFQVLSRKLNQGSKKIGKGGSTQQEWADDSTRMEGLSDNIQSGEDIADVSQKIRKTGEQAERRNNKKFFKRSFKNATGTAHEAGKYSAQNAGVTTLTMSGIMNMVSVIEGEKTGEEAVMDTIRDGGKSAVTGYAVGSSMTVVSQTLSYSSSGFVRALAENNIPGKVVTALAVTGDTLEKWGNGEITTQECMIRLGDKGLNMATMGYSMAVGQSLIPIPVVGGAVGALVGSMLTSNLYNGLMNELQTKQLEHEERVRIIAECKKATEQARVYKEQLEAYINSYFKEYRECFDSAISSMQLSYAIGDANGVIAGANEITRKLGGEVKFETTDEFKAFLDSGEEDCF